MTYPFVSAIGVRTTFCSMDSWLWPSVIDDDGARKEVERLEEVVPLSHLIGARANSMLRDSQRLKTVPTVSKARLSRWFVLKVDQNQPIFLLNIRRDVVSS